jgi:hypothetical protein
MAPRANWKGFLRLSLVTCPVALYPATSESGKISFNQLILECSSGKLEPWLQRAGAICATGANQLPSLSLLAQRGIKMVATAHELPASGYALEVDGRAEFATRDGAKMGAEELKKRFPMLQIRIYDAQTKTREDVLLA